MRAIAKRARKQCFMCGEYCHIKNHCSLRKYRIDCLKYLVSGHFSEVCNIRTKARLLAKSSRIAKTYLTYFHTQNQHLIFADELNVPSLTFVFQTLPFVSQLLFYPVELKVQTQPAVI